MDLQTLILEAWNNRDLLKDEKYSDAVKAVIEEVDKGRLRTASPTEDGWKVNEWVKKAVILYFPIMPNKTIESGAFEYHDKIALKKNFCLIAIHFKGSFKAFESEELSERPSKDSALV